VRYRFFWFSFCHFGLAYVANFLVTSFALYTIPYMISKQAPAIIIAWIFPGRVYPVIERKHDPNSFLGKSLQQGYTAHYVVTNKNGEPMENCDDHSIDYFDEIVVVQESQIVPAFILRMKEGSGRSLYKHYSEFVRPSAAKLEIVDPEDLGNLEFNDQPQLSGLSGSVHSVALSEYV
jgi:hypothetical protein